ncbi:UNVERIFIED_CONTAM: hypothetical protein PYX00_003134 [Menopon gallinae]|uniref:Uncharacterized protein n=1 Tax=Menopon gallinae TaxID=328185 RepID=A0AAW2I117_9NEOP
MESELGLKGEEGDSFPPDSIKSQKQRLIKRSHSAAKTPYGHDAGRYKDFNTLLNIVLCLLCGISVSFSVYFFYREIRLESRVYALELELSQRFGRGEAGLGSEVLIKRLRREVEERFNQKLNRAMSGGRRLLAEEEGSGRTAREVPDCICRPGASYQPL